MLLHVCICKVFPIILLLIHRNFTEAVFDIFNAETVFITSSLFRDNRGTSISPCPYRGNTGAVAIGFNSVSESFSNPCVRVLDSYFINNRATAENAFRTSSGAFFTRVFSGRGGAIGVFIGAFEHNVTVEISDCFFDRNFARSFGGTLYLLMEGEQTRHSLMLNRNQFKNSIGLIGGGAVQLSFLSNGRADNPHTANFTECMFEGNRGDSGGGIYVFPSFLGKCIQVYIYSFQFYSLFISAVHKVLLEPLTCRASL